MTKLNYERNVSVIIRSVDKNGYIKARVTHKPDAEITETYSFYIPGLSKEEALKRGEEQLNKLQDPFNKKIYDNKIQQQNN